MNVQTIIEHLGSGELSHFALVDKKTLRVKRENTPKILALINAALVKLSTRFHLKDSEIFVELQPNITRYHLNSAHAHSNTISTEVKFIRDTILEPFKNDVLKVLAVHNEMGEEFFLNDSSKQYSIFTPAPNVILHPYPKSGNAISVAYQAVVGSIPTQLLVQRLDLEMEDLNIPMADTFLMPLLYFVAARALAGLRDADSTSAMLQLKQQFELECNIIDQTGVGIHEQDEPSKFYTRGFK